MVDYRAMHSLRSLVLVLLMARLASAQGVRMPADFLPLEVGKSWMYDLMNESGQKAGQMVFAVEEYTIVQGTSFYVLSGFPFSSESDEIRFIRYDRAEREFMRKLGSDEGPLFFGDGARTEVLESDDAGVARRFALHTDTMTLTFERGVGIVEAWLQRPAGVVVARLVPATPASSTASRAPAAPSTASPSVSPNAGPAPTVVVPRAAPMVVIPPPAPAGNRRESAVATLSSENPQMNLGVNPSPDGYDIVLVVVNTSEKLLPFRFGSSQTYDFVIQNETGQEVWSWSHDRFFTQVVRSDSIRSKGRWQFQAVWNRRDNAGNALEPGLYRLTAIITSLPPVATPPAVLELR